MYGCIYVYICIYNINKYTIKQLCACLRLVRWTNAVQQAKHEYCSNIARKESMHVQQEHKNSEVPLIFCKTHASFVFRRNYFSAAQKQTQKRFALGLSSSLFPASWLLIRSPQSWCPGSIWRALGEIGRASCRERV